MAFMRRVRRQKFAQGTADALAVPVRPSPSAVFERAGGGETPSEASSSRSPQPSPERKSNVSINELPPGMPKMPVEPPEYARGERRASSLDEEEYMKSKRRLRNVFKKRSHYLDALHEGDRQDYRRNRTPLDSIPTVTISGDSSVTREVDNGHGNNGSGYISRGEKTDPRGGTRTNTGSHPQSHSSVNPSYEGESYYEGTVLPTESPNSRLRLCDLNTKGRYVKIAEEVTQVTRVHDNYVSFIVPHGWIATRTSWGFYLSSNSCIGFVLTASSREASSILCDTRRLCVFSKVHVLSSPVFQSKHTAVVNYAAHDIKGRGIAQYNAGFKTGAVVFALCAPQNEAERLRRVEHRLASTAVVLAIPPKNTHRQEGDSDTQAAASTPTGFQAYYQPIARLSTGTNCVMQ